MVSTVRILGICCSLRRQSYHRLALRAPAESLKEDATIETFHINGISRYNQDLEHRPPRVIELKQRLRESGAVLFATPEYNHSVPGAAGGHDVASGGTIRQGLPFDRRYGRRADRPTNGEFGGMDPPAGCGEAALRPRDHEAVKA